MENLGDEIPIVMIHPMLPEGHEFLHIVNIIAHFRPDLINSLCKLRIKDINELNIYVVNRVINSCAKIQKLREIINKNEDEFEKIYWSLKSNIVSNNQISSYKECITKRNIIHDDLLKFKNKFEDIFDENLRAWILRYLDNELIDLIDKFINSS